MGASESKCSGSYNGPGQGWDYSGQGKPAPGQVPVYYGSPGWDNGQDGPNNSGQTYGQQAYGNPAYGQSYGQNLAPPNPPPYTQNPQGYGQPPPGQPMYGQRPQSSSGPPPSGYAQHSPQPRPQSYPPPNAPPQSHQMAPDRPFGLFASDFMIFLDGSSSQKTMTIGRHLGDVQYRADISFGAHHKMQLFRMNGMNQMLIAGAKGVGFTGSRINVNWADGRFTEMKSSDPSKIKFDVGGNTFLWVKAEKKEISGILGREAGKGFKLVRQGMEEEALAIFSQSAKFDYSKSSGWFCFVGRGASGQMGSDWANMAVLAMLKLWQIKALSKFADITGEGIGAVAGAVGGG